MPLPNIIVHSEVGRLKTVMLHRPGKELESLMPDYLEELLFDDIPFLEDAQLEHDQFAEILRSNGVKVVYLIDLVAEAILAGGLKEQFVETWLNEAKIECHPIRDLIRDYLLNISDIKEMVAKTIEGFKRSEFLTDLTEKDHDSSLFYVNPMPNLYFTRDPFTTIGTHVVYSQMFAETRKRETLYGKYIFTYHPVYGNDKNPLQKWSEKKEWFEGGDVLVLNSETIMIGVSERTQMTAIKKIARKLFNESKVKQIITMEISKQRKFMHLDTVFTMIDYDKFVIHPEIEQDLKVSLLQQNSEGEIFLVQQKDSLESVLEAVLKIPEVVLIRGGDGDQVVAAREQWNDGVNTVAIGPGEVVVYHRNVTTNRQMTKAGIKLHVLKCSELVRGRGGPRCMSMPLQRESLWP